LPGIGPEGAKALADALRVNRVLKKLDLKHNRCSVELIRDAVAGRNEFELIV
jgi:hypothetical protein